MQMFPWEKQMLKCKLDYENIKIYDVPRNIDLEIYGWKHTSRGKKLDYGYVTKVTKKSKKFTDKQIQIILDYKGLIQEGDMNKTTCLNLIDSEHGFRPSMKIFNAILNGSY